MYPTFLLYTLIFPYSVPILHIAFENIKMSPLKITFDFVRTRRYMENSYMHFKNANNYFHIFPYASRRFYGKTDVFPRGGRLRNAPCSDEGAPPKAQIPLTAPRRKNLAECEVFCCIPHLSTCIEPPNAQFDALPRRTSSRSSSVSSARITRSATRDERQK